MKPHTKIYRSFFGLAEDEWSPCERCLITPGKPICKAVDVHHCDRRGMGGDPSGSKDRIENLGGVCRECHEILDSRPEENLLFSKWLLMVDVRKGAIGKIMMEGL